MLKTSPTDLSKKINAAQLNPDMLVGRYIPNLVAKPFEVSREYAQLIYDQTSSPRLDHLFKDFAFERFIEIGPSPTLTGMATRTLKAKYEAQDNSIAT
jgi:fatty acid synthase subunit alpha, fungi type